MTILVVEDDQVTGAFISKGLKEAGYSVERASDGKAALELAQRVAFDLMIVDIMLPGMDGLSFITAMRSAGAQTPVLILSAKRTVDDRVGGLRVGGDDYLVKPFAFAELLARVEALLRRTPKLSDPTLLSAQSISLNLLTREVIRAGKPIDLQIKEFTLLEYFMRNPERVITKTQILDRVWNFSFNPQTNVVDVLVCRLRNKVDRGFQAKTIQTVRGVGYVFKPG
jgi:two-component system OmpR family response regulator